MCMQKKVGWAGAIGSGRARRRSTSSARRGEQTSPETTVAPKGWEMVEKTVAFRQRRAADTRRWRALYADGSLGPALSIDEMLDTLPLMQEVAEAAPLTTPASS